MHTVIGLYTLHNEVEGVGVKMDSFCASACLSVRLVCPSEREPWFPLCIAYSSWLSFSILATNDH